KSILPIFGTKIVIAIVAGYLLDLIIGRRYINMEVNTTKGMESEGYKCVDERKIKLSQVIKHSLERSFKVSIYIYIITVLVSLVVEYFGVDNLSGEVFSEGYLQILLSAAIGLIPNCAISVGFVKLFTMNLIGFSSVIAGLSSNAGLALIFLFKESKSKKKALLITFMLFSISFISGAIIHMLI
ncbi:MAG: putative manganese transporter, partial [Clostridium sp.]